MSKQIQAIRGMNDCFIAIHLLGSIERIIRETVAAYGYEEIRFPIVESTDLFKRSTGEVTDIVEKEMYTFEDRNGDSLTLRPEGTACCARVTSTVYSTIKSNACGTWACHERPQKDVIVSFINLVWKLMALHLRIQMQKLFYFLPAF